MLLTGLGAGAVAVACGDDADDTTTTTTGTTSSGGGASASSSDSVTASTGTTGSGGGATTNTGAGGSTTTSGAGGGGGAGAVCGMMLVVQGSNYASDPHDLTIPVADIEAGVLRTYTTTGNGHTHNVTLGPADFTALKNGETVKKYVCYDEANFTDHEWVISCADPSIAPTFEGEIGTVGNCPA